MSALLIWRKITVTSDQKMSAPESVADTIRTLPRLFDTITPNWSGIGTQISKIGKITTKTADIGMLLWHYVAQ